MRPTAVLPKLPNRGPQPAPAELVEVYAERFEAGHLGPFADAELAIAHQERMLRFAQRVLSG